MSQNLGIYRYLYVEINGLCSNVVYYQRNDFPSRKEIIGYFPSIFSKFVAYTLAVVAIVVILNASFSAISDISAEMNSISVLA
jgi:hypothetical protein